MAIRMWDDRVPLAPANALADGRFAPVNLGVIVVRQGESEAAQLLTVKFTDFEEHHALAALSLAEQWMRAR